MVRRSTAPRIPMQTDLTFLKPLVSKVLTAPFEHGAWTVQGFGFLRTYFGPAGEPKRFRLNLWDHRFSVPGVSTIHDHPWHFNSIIVGGAFCNQRYEMSTDYQSATHMFTTIKTGEGGGPIKTPPKLVILTPLAPELYTPGDTYHQEAWEIHETIFADGTVTLNERMPVADGEHARVFWPCGSEWVDAEPRPATREEVSDGVVYALREWF